MAAPHSGEHGLNAFSPQSAKGISLDEPYSSHKDAKPARREYGSRDGRLETSVTRVALNRAIGELPEGNRAVFLLHEVECYQHREIAELLGCSVGNSKSRLHKAKLQIRDFLAKTPQPLPQSTQSRRVSDELLSTHSGGAAGQWDPVGRGPDIDVTTAAPLAI